MTETEIARDWYTTAEAAVELGLTPTSVRKAIACGRLTPTRIHARLNVITHAELERYRRETLGRRGPKPRSPHGTPPPT